MEGTPEERLDFHHLKVVLARAAFRTRPVDRHVFPARTRRDSFFGQSRGFVVDPAANEAHPAAELLVFRHGEEMGELKWPGILTYLRVSRARRAARCAAPHCLSQMPTLPPIVLTFAASDPTGGAGLQADLLTLASMGCHPLSVVTALTVQDTRGVDDLLAIDSDWVVDQARKLLEDMPVAAFKLGVLGSIDNITAIAEILSDYPEVPVILDPVLASGRGDALAGDEMIVALRELIVPQTTVLTPNSMEARRLAEEDEEGDDPALDECASRLIELGCEYVLITGTHENTPEVINILYGEAGIVRTDRWKRLPGSFHGVLNDAKLYNSC